MEKKFLRIMVENEVEHIVEIEIGKKVKEKLEKRTIEIIKILIDKVKN